MQRFKMSSVSNIKPPSKQLTVEDFNPRRIAINFAPKMIVIEFTRTSTNKLYQKRIKLSPNVVNKTPEQILKALKQRYPVHVGSRKISDSQLLRLVGRLLSSERPPSSNSSNVLQRTNKKQTDSSAAKHNSNQNENANLTGFRTEGQFKLKSHVLSQAVSNDSLFSRKDNTASKVIEIGTPIKAPSAKKQQPPQNMPKEDEDSIAEDFIEDFDDGFDEIEEGELATPAKPTHKVPDASPSAPLSELKGIDIYKDDLNKINARDVQKAKRKMDENFERNRIDKTSAAFKYDHRVEFKAEESNEWDDALVDDF